MSYVEKSLHDNEKVKYSAKLHWKVFITPVVVFALGAYGIFMKPPYNVFGLLGVLLSIVMALKALLNYLNSEFVVTNKRIILRQGIFSKTTVESSLNKIEGIGIEQSIIGRILNSGNIIISGIGGMKSIFFDVDNPIEFRKNIKNS